MPNPPRSPITRALQVGFVLVFIGLFFLSVAPILPVETAIDGGMRLGPDPLHLWVWTLGLVVCAGVAGLIFWPWESRSWMLVRLGLLVAAYLVWSVDFEVRIDVDSLTMRSSLWTRHVDLRDVTAVRIRETRSRNGVRLTDEIRFENRGAPNQYFAYQGWWFAAHPHLEEALEANGTPLVDER